MLAIFVGSSIPGEHIPKLKILEYDKLLHMAEYCILGFLFARALRHSGLNIGFAKMVILAIIITAFYGASDEFHQYFTPGRTADVFDFLADFVGANMGIFIFGIFTYKMRR